MPTTTRPAMAWAGLTLVVLARMFRAMLVTFVVVASIPLVTSWSGYVVRSGSMEPGLSVGNVVVAQPLAAEDRIPVGRVLVFDNPDTGSDHTTLIHRVVKNLGDGRYVTAGDANRENDSTAAARDDFTARPSINVPLVGLPFLWWAEGRIATLALWLVLVALALYFSARPPCDPRHRRRREATRAARLAKRAALVAVPVLMVASAVVVAPLAGADAAFTSKTKTPANTWKVSSTLADTIVLGAVPSDVRGTIPLTATLDEPSGRSFSVRIEYASAGTTIWRTACTIAAAPYSCSWATAGVANADYDLRAVATSGSTTYTSRLVEDVTVDNLAPTVTMQDPGSPLRGTVVTAATATDTHSGVRSVTMQYAVSGGTIFKDICTTTETPFTCRFDTTVVAGGTYSLRAVAVDAAGNSSTSALVTNRVVDNTVASVSMDDPGAVLNGNVTVSATASSSAGITSVRIQRAPAGTTTWTDICTDTATPFSCAWATTGVTDGSYDLRAVMLDKSGKTTISSSITSRRVDNSPMRGADVQTENGGTLAGTLDRGDTMALTYTQVASLPSIASGWNGSATSVTVRLRDGSALGLGSTDDTITVLRNGTAVNLGSVNLRQDYIKLLRTAEFAATMTASTVTVNGVAATRITLTMGSRTAGQSVATVTTSSTMVWTPAAQATTVAGRAASTAATSETGSADREF